MKKITTGVVVLLVLVLIIVTALWLNKRHITNTSAPVENEVVTPLEITQTTITEANFTGSRPVFSGSSIAAIQATQYLDEYIRSFKETADAEVPERIKEFGTDAPPSHYGIDFEAALVEGVTTQSIVIDGYRYMGGANGTSFYKVFTTKKDTEVLLALSDVIKKDQQHNFAEYVKNKILTEQDGIFPEEVKKLTFDSFQNFSLTTDTLIIYFDKYEIGAGALGAIPFSIPLVEIESYLSNF